MYFKQYILFTVVGSSCSAFVSYDVFGVTNLNLGSTVTASSAPGRAAVKFDFLLPHSHPNRSNHRIQTLSSTSPSAVPPLLCVQDCQRHGVMAAFQSFEEFKESFYDLLDLFYDSPPISPFESDSR